MSPQAKAEMDLILNTASGKALDGTGRAALEREILTTAARIEAVTNPGERAGLEWSSYQHIKNAYPDRGVYMGWRKAELVTLQAKETAEHP
jgi:hypothetical protein